MSRNSEPPPSAPNPLISVQYVSTPIQRLSIFSFGLLCQAIKFFNLVQPSISFAERLESCRKWSLFDFIYCIILWQLRLPGLTYSKSIVLLQIGLMWSLNGTIFLRGSGQLYDSPFYSRTLDSADFKDYLDLLNAVFVRSPGTLPTNLLGQHTVRLSPAHTAQLNPDGLSFCVPPDGKSAFVPVFLTDINVMGVRYSFTPASGDRGYGHAEILDLTMKDFKIIERFRDKEERVVTNAIDFQPNFRMKGSNVYLQISRAGSIHLDRVLYSPNIDARIVGSPEITVISCPRVEFVDMGPNEDIRCSTRESDAQLAVDISGIPPLKLRWSKTINGRREYFSIEGIDNDRGLDFDRNLNHRHYPTHGYERVMSEGVSYPRDLRIPLEASLAVAGDHLYILEEIADAVGNVVHLGSDILLTDKSTASKSKIIRSFIVLRRPTVSFKSCSPETPAYMLLGSEMPLVISANSSDVYDSNWDITLKYQPPVDVRNGMGRGAWLSPWEKTFSIRAHRKEIKLPITAPGDYTIVHVKGKRCNGEVLSPETCKVIEKLPPTVEIDWKHTQDCSGETGFDASLSFSGTPPFQVTYSVQRDNESPRELSETFSNMNDNLNRQFERSGRYVVNFVRIGDSNYKRVDLPGPKIEQVIHQRAAAAFVSGKAASGTKRRVLTTCETGTVGVEVELKGKAPWKLELTAGSTIISYTEIQESTTTLNIPIPVAVEKTGGSFELDLVSVEDARKCKQRISATGLLVSVHKNRPTARFQGEDGEHNTTVREYESVHLPLELTGKAPWRVRYHRVEAQNLILTATMPTPPGNLLVTEQGHYEIIDVTDAICTGYVMSNASVYRVDWIPRPSAKIAAGTIMTYDGYNKSHILRPTCQGMVDHVDIDLIGRPPFQIVYNITQAADKERKLLYNPTFYSTNSRSPFQLQTSHPGRVFYEIPQIGDAEYPLAKYKSTVIPSYQRLIFEQQVFIHPSARFKTQAKLSYYLHDTFVPSTSQGGTIVLEGTPPFRLQLSIRHMSTRQVDTMTVDISHSSWKIDIPTYTFRTIGTHSINIESVSDASNCAHITPKSASTSIEVEVSATATIFPYDQREDFCVGDVARFHLEGDGPWKIGYRINANSLMKEVGKPPFAVPLERPGEFVITSITHQQVYRSITPNLHYKVHPLPSALIAYGKVVRQDITEGDQAEIVFTLIGTPPFTFTYQRLELSSWGGGKPGKVLETHKVSHVTTNSHKIYASMEGTWEITSISDLRCQYPVG